LARTWPAKRRSVLLHRLDVFVWCMSRTNIELDDALIAEVMRRYGVRTKREAVDLALRRLVGMPLTREFLQRLKGVGWGSELDELRR
jgi:Arc/MetJ family transcription regulator